jgi:hypothetical protein
LIPLLTLVVMGCGPNLSQPSPLNITGRWKSSDQIGPLSGLQVDITQQQDGILNGQWSGRSLPDAPCPPGLGVSPTGPLNGRSTVLQVQFSLLGAGDFDGQAINAQTLTGSLESCNHPYPITFTRVGSIP